MKFVMILQDFVMKFSLETSRSERFSLMPSWEVCKSNDESFFKHFSSDILEIPSISQDSRQTVASSTETQEQKKKVKIR